MKSVAVVAFALFSVAVQGQDSHTTNPRYQPPMVGGCRGPGVITANNPNKITLITLITPIYTGFLHTKIFKSIIITTTLTSGAAR